MTDENTLRTQPSDSVVEAIASFVENWNGDTADGHTGMIASEIRERFAAQPRDDVREALVSWQQYDELLRHYTGPLSMIGGGVVAAIDEKYDLSVELTNRALEALSQTDEQPGMAYRIPSLSDRERVFAGEPYDPPCSIPPKGWRCTRKPGHEGPCAAIPETDRIDTQGTDSGLADELEAFLVSHPEGDASQHPLFARVLTALRTAAGKVSYWRSLAKASLATSTDRKAVLEEAAKVADEIAEEWGNRWQYTSDKHETYENGRIAGWSDGAADVAKQIRLFAKESTQ